MVAEKTSKGQSVLVVEDDESLRKLIQLMLEAVGHRVATAENGRVALEKVKEEMPAVILLDMKMPVMNGWEFAAALREKYHRAVPIVVLTAAHDAKERADEVEAEGWLAKPFQAMDLIKTVEGYLAAPPDAR